MSKYPSDLNMWHSLLVQVVFERENFIIDQRWQSLKVIRLLGKRAKT